MDTFFKKTPDEQHSFISNYKAHLHCLYDNVKSKKKPEFVRNPLVVFKPLRDAYDLTDIVLGATIAPVGGVLIGVLLAGWAVVELLLTLLDAITLSLSMKSAKETTLLLLTTLAVPICSILLAIHSTFSLMSRLVATAFCGFAPQDEPRFAYEKDKDTVVDDQQPVANEAQQPVANDDQQDIEHQRMVASLD